MLANEPTSELRTLVELGLQHEQQHQELLLMDLLDGFSRQPLEPIYGVDADLKTHTSEPQWLACEGGVVEIGAQDNNFHFDNETPRHRVWLDPFQISDELVSNANYAAFIDDGGYQRPELWMSDGWGLVQQHGWTKPRYWRDAHDELALPAVNGGVLQRLCGI